MPMIVRKIILMIVFSLVVVGTTSAGIARVAKRYTTLELLGGYSMPVGTFNGIGQINFDNSRSQRLDLNAKDVYDPSVHFGLTYGSLFNRHMWLGLGFRYTHVAQADSFIVDDYIYFFLPDKPTISQFDLDMNYNYLFTDISQQRLAPFVGAGFRAGLTSFSGETVDTEAEVNLAMVVNAGVEVRLYSAPAKRSFVTLVSANSYEFWVSGNRPKYLNIGLALKYYYRL